MHFATTEGSQSKERKKENFERNCWIVGNPDIWFPEDGPVRETSV